MVYYLVYVICVQCVHCIVHVYYREVATLSQYCLYLIPFPRDDIAHLGPVPVVASPGAHLALVGELQGVGHGVGGEVGGHGATVLQDGPCAVHEALVVALVILRVLVTSPVTFPASGGHPAVGTAKVEPEHCPAKKYLYNEKTYHLV